jgi:3alpha(or 20beta)-hydroxysteroid dehydrogenase
MGKLDGRVVLISGAARGQGEAEARLFATEGANVLLGDVLDEAGEAVAEDVGKAARYIHLDVRSEDDWTAAVELAVASFGHLDGLVNNAGILRFALLEDCSLDDYRNVVDVNQVGVFLGMRAAAPALTAAGGGTIVNTSSVSGIVGMPGLVAYTATKFAIRGMTKVAAMELGPRRIRVNAVCPGGVKTPMTHPEQTRGMVSDGSGSSIYRNLPLGRIGQAEEVARMALFLTSDDSSYCTGTEFVLDGGWTAGPTFG